jgi:hypothetical protein
MWERKTGMIAIAIATAIAIVLRAAGKFLIDKAIAQRITKAPRKKR